MIVIICAKYKKNPSITVDATEQTRFSKSRPNDLEDIGQGQRSLCATHPLIVVIICTKYGKNPSRTVDVTERTQQAGQTDGRTDRLKPIYPPTTLLFEEYNNLCYWIHNLGNFFAKPCLKLGHRWMTLTFKMISSEPFPIESTKTTSLEDVSTGVLAKIKNIEEVKIQPKNDMMYQDIYNCICQNTKKYRYTIQYVKPTAQMVFKIDFQKVDQHAGGKWLIHNTKVGD